MSGELARLQKESEARAAALQADLSAATAASAELRSRLEAQLKELGGQVTALRGGGTDPGQMALDGFSR